MWKYPATLIPMIRQAAISAGNSEAVRVAPHTIKGSCGNIGAMQMRETASTLEAAAKTGDIGDASTGLARLKEEFHTFNQQVDSNTGGFNGPACLL